MIARLAEWAAEHVELAIVLLAFVLVVSSLAVSHFGHAGWSLGCGINRGIVR